MCRELAAILEGEADLEFATIMVQVDFPVNKTTAISMHVGETGCSELW